MADTLAIDLRCTLAWLFQEEGPLATVSDSSKLEYSRTFEDGTATDQADKLWHQERTLAGGASDDWDLTSLSTALFGGTLTLSLAKVKAVLLVNLSTVASDVLQLRGAASNPWFAPFNSSSDHVKAPADSCVLLTNRKSGWTVTGGSADVLRVHNPGGAAVSYRIVIAGTSV
jgi:hypothetical protein